MKYFLIFSVVIAVAYGLDAEFIAKAKAKMEQIGGECMTETGATADDVAQLRAKQPPSTHEGKCFVMCFQRHLGVFNADGKLDKAGGIAHLDVFKDVDADLHAKAVQMLETCYGAVTDEDDSCETGLNFAICVKTTAEKMGLDSEIFD